MRWKNPQDLGNVPCGVPGDRLFTQRNMLEQSVLLRFVFPPLGISPQCNQESNQAERLHTAPECTLIYTSTTRLIISVTISLCVR